MVTMDQSRGSGRLEQEVPAAQADQPTLSRGPARRVGRDEQADRGSLRVQRRRRVGLPGRPPVHPAGASYPTRRRGVKPIRSRSDRTGKEPDHGAANGRLPQPLVPARLPRVPGEPDGNALRPPDGTDQLRLLCAGGRHRGAHRPRWTLRPERPHRGPGQGRPRYPDHEHHHPWTGDAAGRGGRLLGEAQQRLIRSSRPGLSRPLLRLRRPAVSGARRGGQGARALSQRPWRQGHPGLLQRQRRAALPRQVRPALGGSRTPWTCPSSSIPPCP